MASTYRPFEAIQLLRPTFRTARFPPPSRIAQIAPFSTTYAVYATHSSTTSSTPSAPQQPTRRTVTVTNDTGAVRWSDLSLGEKAARTTQQSFNFAIIMVGVVLTGAVSYYVYTEILSPSSKTSHFNRAVTRIRSHPDCVALLGGPGPQIAAYGEPSFSRWARNRFIASTSETDKWGTEHMRFKFYVEGSRNQGVVNVHLTRRPGQEEWEYQSMVCDVKGERRVVVEQKEEVGRGKGQGPKIFGARWW